MQVTRGKRSDQRSPSKDRLCLMMGVTISLAQTVEEAGALSIARTAFTDGSQTGGVG